MILGKAQLGKTAIEEIEQLKPHILFLDIQLPDMTGFKILNQLTYLPLVIFTTAYAEYAIQAFETYAIDYLVKPFDADRFKKAIDKLKRFTISNSPTDYQQLETLFTQLPNNTKPFALPIKIGKNIRLLDFEDIIYFKAEDKYVRVFIQNGDSYLYEKSLSHLSTKLPNNFIRIHRSYIINASFIQEIQKYFKGNFVVLLNDANETSLITGTKYVANLKRQLGW
jgi:two-component system LytT family response regulator